MDTVRGEATTSCVTVISERTRKPGEQVWEQEY